MAYTKIMTTPLTGGKSVYTSEILNNKFTELQNLGDVAFTHETLEDSTVKTTQDCCSQTHIWALDNASIKSESE